jgi:hypothetical protein
MEKPSELRQGGLRADSTRTLRESGATEGNGDRIMSSAATTATWEYLTLPEAERDRLAQLGLEGWELVAVGGGPDEPMLYLKRPVQDLSARATTEQRNRYYLSRGLDPERSPQDDAT